MQSFVSLASPYLIKNTLINKQIASTMCLSLFRVQQAASKETGRKEEKCGHCSLVLLKIEQVSRSISFMLKLATLKNSGFSVTT